MENTKSLFDCITLEEIAGTFSLDELVTFARKRNLHEWLDFNFYNAAANKIISAVENDASDAELKLIICEIFNINFDSLPAADAEEISAVIAKKQHITLFADKPADGRKTAFVESQSELVRELRDGAQLVYLYGGEFHIPYNLNDITYVGRGNAIVDFDCPDDIDLDAKNIILEDLQIYLSHPIAIKADKSANLKIINGVRKTLASRPTLKEILEIMNGRGAFEPKDSFASRAENIKGVAVGNALLVDSDYNIDTAAFKINPRWDFNYIAVTKDFAQGRNFLIELAPESAELLYTNERRLQIFADFTSTGDKLTIASLYFDTQTLGRLDIISTIREIHTETSTDGSYFGSGISALGYGLNLITDYEDR